MLFDAPFGSLQIYNFCLLFIFFSIEITVTSNDSGNKRWGKVLYSQ